MKIQTLTLTAVAALIAGTASAQTYTDKLGGAYIQPNANSSNFSGQLPSGAPTLDGVTLEVRPKAAVLFSVERAVNDNLGVELVLGLPPTHDVKLKITPAVRAAAGSDGRATLFTLYADKKIAEVKQVAPTLFFNYKYGTSGDAWRPYVGLGINYTKMDPALTAEGKALYQPYSMSQKLSSSVAPAVQAGITYKIDRTWSLNAGVVSTFVSSTLKVTGNGQTHTAKFDFTPTVYTASVGYSF